MKPTTEQIEKLPKWARAYVAELESSVVRLSGIPDAPIEVAPDLPPPEYSSTERLSRGWDFNFYHLKDRIDGAVSKRCSSSVYHGSGWEKTSSQRPIRLYSTEKLAWKAAKAKFTQWAAEQIAKIEELETNASDHPERT